MNLPSQPTVLMQPPAFPVGAGAHRSVRLCGKVLDTASNRIDHISKAGTRSVPRVASNRHLTARGVNYDFLSDDHRRLMNSRRRVASGFAVPWDMAVRGDPTIRTHIALRAEVRP